jgi:hypothetical protein
VLKKSVFLEFWLNWQTFTILHHCFYWKKFPVHAGFYEKATFSTQSAITRRITSIDQCLQSGSLPPMIIHLNFEIKKVTFENLDVADPEYCVS